MQLEPHRVVRVDHRLREPVDVAALHPGAGVGRAGRRSGPKRSSVAARSAQIGLHGVVDLAEPRDHLGVVGGVGVVVERARALVAHLPGGAGGQQVLVDLQEPLVGRGDGRRGRPRASSSAASSRSPSRASLGGEQPARHPAVAAPGEAGVERRASSSSATSASGARSGRPRRRARRTRRAASRGARGGGPRRRRARRQGSRGGSARPGPFGPGPGLGGADRPPDAHPLCGAHEAAEQQHRPCARTSRSGHAEHDSVSGGDVVGRPPVARR